MMMKSKKTNKKLALMVGMALSFGVAYGMAPSDVALAATVVGHSEADGYTIQIDGGEVSKYDDVGDDDNGFYKGLKDRLAVASEVITINVNDGALRDSIKDKEFTLGNSTQVNVNYSDNNSFSVVAGESGGKITLASDGTVTGSGGGVSLVANLQEGKTSTLGAWTGAVNTLTVNGADGSTLELKGSNEFTTIEVKDGTNVTLDSSANITAESMSVAGSITADGSAKINAKDIQATGDITLTGATVGDEVKTISSTGGAVTADALGSSVESVTAKGDVSIATLGTATTAVSGKNVTITDAVNNENTNITATGKLTVSGGITKAGDVVAGDVDATGKNITAKSLQATGDITATSVTADTISAKDMTVGTLTTTANSNVNVSSLTINTEYNGSAGGSVTTGTLTIGDGATTFTELGNVTAEKIVLKANGDDLANNNVSSDTLKGIKNSAGGTPVIGLTDLTSGTISDDLKNAVRVALGLGADAPLVIYDQGAQDDAFEAVNGKYEAAETAIANCANELAKISAVEVANADPFNAKLPTASELATLAADGDNDSEKFAKARDALLEAKGTLTTALEKPSIDKAAISAKLAEVNSKLAAMPTSAADQAAKLTAAVQQAGKTAAAPAVTSARAATAITTVLTNNVVTRTAEIRGFASAVDEGRPEPDKMWFQYKHTNMDVDGGDVYSKSTINTNNFQLGYDTQIGTNDYLGAYIGTTTGNADFNGPARSGRIDIDNSFDFGVYGTHMLPNDQYIDYMVHTGKFDSEYDSSKWGTTDTGAMVGYGAKIAQGDRLTMNPYIQLAYDKISVDSYTTRAGNVIKSDDSNNWTAKLGMNLIDASGLYGGVAYSRGLSGSYNAYINGVAMPTSDYNANVLYLSLGYRASMAKNAVLDLSMEKTFMDYKGWTAAGKVNFYF